MYVCARRIFAPPQFVIVFERHRLIVQLIIAYYHLLKVQFFKQNVTRLYTHSKHISFYTHRPK